jgi:hypothetical protein
MVIQAVRPCLGLTLAVEIFAADRIVAAVIGDGDGQSVMFLAAYGDESIALAGELAGNGLVDDGGFQMF